MEHKSDYWELYFYYSLLALKQVLPISKNRVNIHRLQPNLIYTSLSPRILSNKLTDEITRQLNGN